jgi:putative superfamily III holin-X
MISTVNASIPATGQGNSMAHDRVQNSGLARALSDLFADLGDLLQKELQLAKTEITEKIASRLRASVWMVLAGVLGMVAALLVVEAAVFALASFGLALHWSCLLVAALLAAAGAAAFYHGRSMTDDELLPARSARQITKDIETAKEQLT